MLRLYASHQPSTNVTRVAVAADRGEAARLLRCLVGGVTVVHPTDDVTLEGRTMSAAEWVLRLLPGAVFVAS